MVEVGGSICKWRHGEKNETTKKVDRGKNGEDKSSNRERFQCENEKKGSRRGERDRVREKKIQRIKR